MAASKPLAQLSCNVRGISPGTTWLRWAFPMPLTKQQVFDKVWERAKVKKRSLNSEGSCSYRVVDGPPCFIGACIPDAQYRPEIERQGVYGLAWEGLLPDSLDPRDVEFLAKLQSIHDTQDPPEWEDRLMQLAFDYDLLIPE